MSATTVLLSVIHLIVSYYERTIAVLVVGVCWCLLVFSDIYGCLQAFACVWTLASKSVQNGATHLPPLGCI